jgi:hypothetical protein
MYRCEQCKTKKTEVKLAWKEYKKRNEVSSSRHCSCKKKYVKLLDEKKRRWHEMKLGQMN